MAKKKRKNRPGKAANKAANQAIRDQGGFVTSVDQKMAKQKALLAAGKTKKAAKVGNRILKQTQKQPLKGLPMGQYYAQDEFQTNLEANRPNQQTIGGSREYVTDPETGKVTVQDSLSAEQQALYDQQIAQLTQANQRFSDAFNSGVPYGQAYDFSQAPAAPATQDLAQERQRIENEVYDRNISQFNKTADRDRERLEQRLYETGNPPGTPGYEAQMAQFNDQKAAQEAGIRQDAVATAGAEFQRSFNIGQAGRQAAIGEMITGRAQPLSELQALGGFGGGPTVNPQFFGFQPVQYQGPQYLDYLQTGIDAQLGRGALANERAALNKAGGGGGGYGGPPPIPFSIGGAPGALPPPANTPNPVSSGFGAGIQAGVGIGSGLV